MSQLSQDLYIRTIPVYKNLSYDCLTPPEADPKGENKKTVYVDWMRVLNNGNIPGGLHHPSVQVCVPLCPDRVAPSASSSSTRR